MLKLLLGQHPQVQVASIASWASEHDIKVSVSHLGCAREDLSRAIQELFAHQLLLVVDGTVAAEVLRRVDGRQAKHLFLAYWGSMPSTKDRQRLARCGWHHRLSDEATEVDVCAAIRIALGLTHQNAPPATVFANVSQIAANYLAGIHGLEDVVGRFIADVAPLAGATSIGVFASGTSERTFFAVAGDGAGEHATLRAEVLGSRQDFLDQVVLHPDRTTPHSPERLDAERSATVVATAKGWRESLIGIVFTVSPTYSSELLSHVARELVGLYRTDKLFRKAQTLEYLGAGTSADVPYKEWLWRACERLKGYFRTEAASILLLTAESEHEVNLAKHSVHYARRERVEFKAQSGFAFEVIRSSKPLIAIEILPDGKSANCLSYDIDASDHSACVELTVRGLELHGTIENEKSILYAPILDSPNENRVIGVLKIGSLRHADAFSFEDLCDLRSFATALGPILAAASLKGQVEEQDRRLNLRAEMLDDAETLFYYRTAAIGIFHQLGNILLSSSIEAQRAKLMLQSIVEHVPQSLRISEQLASLGALIDGALAGTNEGKIVVSDAKKRSERGVILKDCMLLDEIVRPAIADARRKAPNLDITTSLHNVEYKVFVDTRLFRETLANVLNNSILAVKENVGAGRQNIHISVRQGDENNQVVILVEDTGVGIPPEMMGRLFAPFSTTRGTKGGSGLGLHFARNILRKFQGDISIARTLPKKGTTMKITLPYKEILE